MKLFLRFLVRTFIGFIILILVIYASLWIWNIYNEELPQEEARFGVTFSKLYAEDLGLDWKETYIAILDDLDVERIRISAYWSEVEPEEGVYDFEDMDFQVYEANRRDIEIILAMGRKLPRWPECHIPEWALDRPDQGDLLLAYEAEVIKQYKKVPYITHWQIENEPFLPGFGICPKRDDVLLDQEISLARTLDDRPILITDSGELGDWVRARSRGDAFGTTMYRYIWNDRIGQFKYPLPPTWFKFKDYVSRIFTGELKDPKDVFVIEMQAEAWGEHPIPFLTLDEQFSYMDFEMFKDNIVYARRAGFPDIYLWGVEWWYYLKTTQDHPEFWTHAKTLF